MSLCPSVLPTVHSMCPTLVHRGPSVPQYSLPFTVCVLPLYTEVPLSLSTPYLSQCVSYPRTPSLFPSVLPTVHSVCPTLVHRGPSVPQYSLPFTVCVLPLYTKVPLSLSTPYRSQCVSYTCTLSLSTPYRSQCVSYPCTPSSLCPSVLPTVHSVCPTLVHRGPSVPQYSYRSQCVSSPCTPRSLCPSVLPTVHSVCPTLVHRGPSVPQYSLPFTVCILPLYTEVPLSLSTPYRSQCVSYPCTLSLSTPYCHSVCPTLVHRPSVPQYSLLYTVCVLPSYTEVPLSLSTPYRSQCVSYPCTPRSLCPSVLPTVHSVCPTLVHPVPSVPQYSLPFTVCLTLVH
ncbi:uncharacterized protein [Hemitrygon akajei]|uniref:uncharacterized protein isoform X2 n=1 Tax=Hemitrygon akajei TaxID=2704970 RepID=UPI003BF9A43D